MNNAIGTVNMLIREGAAVYEALYQPSYRHTTRRLSSLAESQMWPTEAAAIMAIERAADNDGASVMVSAGTYPRGTRKRGEIFSRLK